MPKQLHLFFFFLQLQCYFCSNYFSSILRHSIYKRYILLKQIIKFGYRFYHVIYTMIDIILTHFGDALCKKHILFVTCGAQLDNGMTSL
jgi:hypothetical protein